MALHWRVFGADTAETINGPVDLKLRPRSVLIRLLLEPNQRVSWEVLASFLWAESPPKTPRNSIARFVADLRLALGPLGDRIGTVDGGYRVDVREDELDWQAAQSLLEQSRRVEADDLVQTGELLRAAIQLVGTTPNPWIIELADGDAVRRHNDGLQLDVLEAYVSVRARQGRNNEVISAVEHALESHQYNERLWTHLILALHRSARMTEALRACQRVRAALADVGLEPNESIQNLEERILAGSPASAVPLAGIGALSAGRGSDVNALVAATAAYRLVSIVGLPGFGKASVAAAVAQIEESNGVLVYQVDLESLRSSSRVVPAIASAVGIPSSQRVLEVEELAVPLVPVSCLLVIENCEHLRPECAELIRAILKRAHGVRFLITSREPLGVVGEHDYRLGALPTVREQGADRSLAERAFLEAAAILDSQPIEPDDLAEIGAICEGIQGHPLAIDLAASQFGQLGLADLRRRLTEPPPRTAAAALDRTLDTVWSLLDPAQQASLARLSVFPGGCTHSAATEVCGLGEPIDECLNSLSLTADLSISSTTDTRCADRYAILRQVA